MKKSIFTLASLLFLNAVNAQQISVTSGSAKFSNGIHNAYSVTIYQALKDDVESKWKSLLKDFKNEKVKSEKGDVFGDNVIIKDWGNNPVDIYTTFEEDKSTKTIIMHVAFDLGGVYLSSSDNEKSNNAEEID